MNDRHNEKLRANAQRLRREMTKEERHLWYDFLKGLPITVNRQKVMGNYIADFYCAEAKLVIELDGSQHYEEPGREADELRDAYFSENGIRVLRYSNADINGNFEAVCLSILQDIAATSVTALPCRFPLKGTDTKEKTMKQVTIYTDGACSGNPGPGGWGAILEYKGTRRELSGGESKTTNNRMELTGAIRALEALKESCIVELYSDSKYLIDGLSKGWAESWRKKGWIKSDKKPALNPDLWGTLLDLCAQHEMRYHWVKGHAENPWNNRCDALAVQQRDKFAK